MLIRNYTVPILTPIQNPVVLMMPSNAIPLSFQVQRGHFALWALINEDAPEEQRPFSLYGTGHPMDKFPGRFIGTAQAGTIVWHLFDEG